MYNLTTTILALPNIIGCEEFPRSEHGKLLVEDINNFINNNYRLTGNDLIKAFDMAATHSLYLDGKRVDPSTFGKHLSRASVGKILTAYKESKQDKKARPVGYNSKQLNEAKVKLVTPEEAYSMILDWCNEDDKLPLAAPYLQCFEYLVSMNVINQQSITKGGENRKGMMCPTQIIGGKRKAVEDYFTKNVL